MALGKTKSLLQLGWEEGKRTFKYFTLIALHSKCRELKMSKWFLGDIFLMHTKACGAANSKRIETSYSYLFHTSSATFLFCRLSYFNEVDGVIYIASLSGYNLNLEEDPSENQMIECIKLFYTLTNSAFFAKTPFILFLNKTDVFKWVIFTNYIHRNM